MPLENGWNPWHGCTKVSPGCAHCYVYRIDGAHGNEISSCECRKTAAFGAPVAKKRDGSFKIPQGALVYTCFTSDFFIKDADEWRPEAWRMIRERSDCRFFFFTKRIERIYDCIPDDWGEGYDNVIIGCTVENNAMAQKRLPLFLEAPIKHRTVGVEPMREAVNLAPELAARIDEVAVGGESGPYARRCEFDWILDLRRQCIDADTAFVFHQTGENFVKDGRAFRIPRHLQGSQARRAGLDWKPYDR
ncbi:MAG: phage Gp37/Gp68 family protein [Clostridia bacterium]|nr:phage Gp37/Gp68 family protein [Clostridia bacterium]